MTNDNNKSGDTNKMVSPLCCVLNRFGVLLAYFIMTFLPFMM